MLSLMRTIRPVRVLRFGSCLTILLLFGGCASTVMEETWTSPDVDAFAFDKAFILAAAAKEDDRLFAENAIARQITRIPTVRSVEVLKDAADLKDENKVLEAVKASGADGLIVVRMVNMDSRISRGPITTRPMDYITFSGYWGTTYDVTAFFASDPRSISIDNIFHIEIKVFDVATEKLLWSGLTRTSQSFEKTPNVGELIEEVAKVVKSALRSQRLVR